MMHSVASCGSFYFFSRFLLMSFQISSFLLFDSLGMQFSRYTLDKLTFLLSILWLSGQPQRRKLSLFLSCRSPDFFHSGSHLLSHTVSSAVPSAA